MKTLNNKVLFTFFYLMFILILSIIGGFRDVSVGTDLEVYGELWFKQISHYKNIKEVILYSHNHEYGYMLLNYLCSRINSNLNFFLFISELIKILLVSYTAIYFRNKLNSSVFILIYLLFFYTIGFNLMRQALALSFSIFSIIYLDRKKYIDYIIIIIIAFLFHNSASIMLILLPFPFLNKSKNKFFIGVMIILLIYFGFLKIFMIISNSDLFIAQIAQRYLNTGVASSKTNIFIALFMLLNSIIILPKKSLSNNTYYVVIFSLLSLTFLSFSSYLEIAFRISYYPMFAAIIYFLVLLKDQKMNKICLLYNLLFIIYFIFECSHGLAGTIPYSSKILGI